MGREAVSLGTSPLGQTGLDQAEVDVDLNGTLLRSVRTSRGALAVGDIPRISVVIPALNEAENLPHVLPRIGDWADEVLLVDGRSTDDTVAVATRLRPGIRVITESTRGKGAALRAGFGAATGDVIVMLDADCSTDPSEIPLFVGALLAGADVAKGSRFMQGGGTVDMPGYRRLGNWGFVQLVRTLFGGRYSDLCYGYIAFWRRVLPSLNLDSDGFEIETVLNIRALRTGLKVVEVPSFEHARWSGESRLRTFADGWRVLNAILRERVRRLPAPGHAAVGPLSPEPVEATQPSPLEA